MNEQALGCGFQLPVGLCRESTQRRQRLMCGRLLPITPGWNYAVRLYRPRAQIVNGTWRHFPSQCP